MANMQALFLNGSKVASRILGPRLILGVPERGITVWSAVATRQALKVPRALSTKIHPDIKAESTHSNAGESSPAAGPRVFNESNSANRETAEQANGESPTSGELLVVYSKPGCCLCDGLKDKLQLILASPSSPVLRKITLEVRDITTQPEWENAYQYEIPVMTRLTADGTELPIARQSPRVSLERLQQHLVSAFGKRAGDKGE